MDAKVGVIAELSTALGALATKGGAGVVRVDGRRAAPSSGVAWSEDGLVVAPHHALEWDEEVEVGLPGGETVEATVLGRDPTTDVALLRAKGARLEPPSWADGAPAAGQLVVALSRPGRTHRAALGVVGRTAGAWRAPTGGKLDAYLEVTLPRRPGLSGGLVLDAGGAALGMATSGLVRGLAVVIPPSTLRRVAEALATQGHVPRGWLGVATFPVRLPGGAAVGQGRGLLVTAVEAGSPAAKAGVLLGDAIVSLGGEPVGDFDALLAQVEPERIGTTVAVRAIRAGAPVDLSLTIGSRPRGGTP